MTDPNKTSVGDIKSPVCAWCDKTRDQHVDSYPSNGMRPKTPCGGLKSKFLPERVEDRK